MTSFPEKMIRIEMTKRQVAVVHIDQPGEPLNTLKKSFADEFHQTLETLRQMSDLSAVVLISDKPDNFVAGADLTMLAEYDDPEVISSLSRIGQLSLEELEKFPVPVVAAIHGSCLGGGLEIALACRGRIVSDHEKTKLGLPEVQLGLLPGMGGTQRLPRLVGLETALDLLLTGKQLDAKKAKKIGLVDAVVPVTALLNRAIELALSFRAPKPKESWFRSLKKTLAPAELKELLLAENPLGRYVVFEAAKKKLAAKTFGNYPAPYRILDVVRTGLERGFRAGYESESEAFGRLSVTPESKALRHVFFAEQATKKKSGALVGVAPKTVKSVAVVGAGLMGAGITAISVQNAKVPVRLKEVDVRGLQNGMLHLSTIFRERVARKKLSEREASELLSRVTRASDYSGFSGQDLVIEAVFEDLALKRRIVGEVFDNAGKNTIFASNTSALPISSIAEGAARPELVVGMHYFSPVEKMPLLEIIRTSRSADWAVATCVEFGRKQGKTVIVVKDGPGFYTTRILAPYLNEAAYLLLEGHSIEAIDSALVQAGFPVGPLQLLDEIGIDVGAKVSRVLADAFGERMAAPKPLFGMVESGRLGKKAKKGFYLYGEKTSGPRAADRSVYEEFGLRPGEATHGEKLSERCLLAMVNEAMHAYGEAIVMSADDGDVGAIFGLGFPPFLGGPFHYVDARGVSSVVERLQVLERKFGQRFAPAPVLLEMKESGRSFYRSL